MKGDILFGDKARFDVQVIGAVRIGGEVDQLRVIAQRRACRRRYVVVITDMQERFRLELFQDAAGADVAGCVSPDNG